MVTTVLRRRLARAGLTLLSCGVFAATSYAQQCPQGCSTVGSALGPSTSSSPSSSAPSGSSSSYPVHIPTAAEIAAAERAAKDRALAERLEKERRLAVMNNALDAELNKPDPNEMIELEMTRDEFAPMADQVARQVLNDTVFDTNDYSVGDASTYEEIAPARGTVFADAFRAVRDGANSYAGKAREAAEQFMSDLPDTIFSKGLESATENDVGAEMMESISPSREELAPSEPTIGSAIKDKIYNFAGGQAWTNIQERLQNGYVDLVMKQRGVDPSNTLERANVELEVKAHPLTGLLPHLARAGANVPKAVYEYGKTLIESGSKMFGLAADSLTDESND